MAEKKLRDYLTSKEKQSLKKSFQTMQKKIEKQIQKLRPGSYDRAYLRDSLKELKKSYQTASWVL